MYLGNRVVDRKKEYGFLLQYISAKFHPTDSTDLEQQYISWKRRRIHTDNNFMRRSRLANAREGRVHCFELLKGCTRVSTLFNGAVYDVRCTVSIVYGANESDNEVSKMLVILCDNSLTESTCLVKRTEFSYSQGCTRSGSI